MMLIEEGTLLQKEAGGKRGRMDRRYAPVLAAVP
jgi:hypothetical protein